MGNSQISVKLEDILNQTQDNDILQMTNAFVQQDISTDQFFEYIENIDIRSLIKQKPNEFQIFLGIIIYNLVEYSLQNEIKSNQVQYLINNLRIFIAIGPILHEIEFLNFTDNFYWNKLVITKRQEFQETVNGIALLFALQKLFMMPNFTVNYTNVPWETLTGENLNRNRKFDENRLTLLQCILALFGATLYRHNHGELFINPFIKYFTSPQNIKLNLVYESLLATVLQHRENGFLPFSSMTQNKIQRHDLALLSSQLVSIMMYETGNWELANNQLDDSLAIQAIYRNYIGQFQSTNGQQLTVSSVMQGIYSNQVSQILQEDVCGVAINSVQKFVKSMLNLLENPVKFSQQLIYGSFGQIGFVEELLAIFYRYATRNQKFYEEILESKKDLVKMFKVIMFCFCSSLEHQSMNNPFFICLAIFIHFSESDNFKQMLKMDLDFSYPSLRYFPVVGGSYGDFLVSCISQNIINGHFNNKNHYAYNQMALMTNISNILQNLSELTSNKLMQLMQVFTDFDFLLQNVYHPLCLIKLMSFIDNVLALQANQNPYLIFELCKSSNIINRAYKINFQENTLRGFLGDPQALEKMQAKIHNRSIRKSSSIQNQPSQQLQQSQQQENRQRQLPFTNKEPKKIILPNEEQKQDDKFFNSFAHKMPKEEQENLIQFWKNFDWQNYRKNMPRNNLEAVLLKVQEYLKQSNKKTLSVELIYEMCNKKVFKDVVQVSEANYNTESFDLNGEIELILRSYTWSNVFAKSTQRPFFDPEKCVFYQRISQQHYADIFHQNLEDFEGEDGGEEGEQGEEQEFQNNEQDASLENHPSNDDFNKLNKRKNMRSKENELQIQDKQEVQFQKMKSNEQVQGEKEQKVENYEDEEEEEEESKISKSGEVKKPPQKKSSNNNNLYIISEADSKKEETMMAQGIHKRFSNYLDQDELKLREKTMNSSRKLDISNIKTAEKKDMGSFLNFTNQMISENNEKIKQDKSKNEDEQVNQKQEQTLQVPVLESYSKVEEKENMGEIEGKKLGEVQVQNEQDNQNENQKDNQSQNENENQNQDQNENYEIQIQKQIELEQLDYERKKEELEKLEQNQQNEEIVDALQEGDQNQSNGYKQQKFKSRARKEKQQNDEQQQQVEKQEEQQELQENQEDFGDEEQVEIKPVQLEELSGKKVEGNSEEEICDDDEQQQQLQKQQIELENLQHEEKDQQQQEQQVDQQEQLEQQNNKNIETFNQDQDNNNEEKVNLEKEQNQEQLQEQQENQNQSEQEKENENETKEYEQEQQDNDKNNEQHEQQSGKKKKNKKRKNKK